MSYYENVYKKRANRFGTDYKTRLQGEREYAFENYLKKSVFRIDFIYNLTEHPATFEPYKQNETQTLHYLLTRVDLDMPPGTILMLPDKNNNLNPWMIYWLETTEASGYNRYTMLKMTHTIEWVDRNHNKNIAYAYMYGQEDNMLKDELKSRSRSKVLYNENLKLSFFVTPTNSKIEKEDYFTISTEDMAGIPIKEGYRVTGYDVISTKGVEFVSVDPLYLMDETPLPRTVSGEQDSPEYFWLNTKEYHNYEEVDE